MYRFDFRDHIDLMFRLWEKYGSRFSFDTYRKKKSYLLDVSLVRIVSC